MTRRVCLWVLLSLLLLGCCSVHGAEVGCDFTLSDAEVKSGRLFSVSLCVNSKQKIAAFVGEITFDENTVEYREAKATDNNALLSVNSKEKNKITFVYLCEDGVECSGKTEIITFVFKAKMPCGSELSLSAKDVIDSVGNEVLPVECKGALVTATGSAGEKDGEKSHDTTGASERDFSYDSNVTNVKGNSVNIYIVGSVVACVSVALVIVAYVFYKLGVRKHKKESACESEESEVYEEKT